MKQKTNIVQIETRPWFPAEVRRRMPGGRAFTYLKRFSRAEKKILRRKEQIPVSAWAEKYRVLTMSSIPGPWKNAVTPYLAGIMDAAMFPSVETLVVVAAPQTGKSEAVHNIVGYCIDRYPGPVLYVYPDELTARENSRDRILPMIESSARLRSYMTGVQDDTGMMRINLQHMPIYTGWARSAARLANKPIKIVVFDETDKYPETAGPKETDPISLGEKRTITYSRGRKIIKLSTPTTERNFIWAAYRAAEVRYEYWVKCPSCGAGQRMDLNRIRVPEGMRDPAEIKRENLARYICADCSVEWDDQDRNRAVRMGEWKEQGSGFRVQGSEDKERGAREEALGLQASLWKRRPRSIAFHIPSWLSPFVSMSEIMADWFACHHPVKDKTKLKDFLNAHKAEPWKDYSVERAEDKILALRDERPAGMVPGGGKVAALVAGVDTQDNGFYYRIRAFGWGQEQESWGVRKGFVDSFEALGKVLFEDVARDPEGNEYQVELAIQDAMGHKTDEVYDFVRPRQGRIVAAQGVDTKRMASLITWSVIEFYPGTKKAMRGAIRLLRHDANKWKTKLNDKLNVNPEDPGAFHLESEIDYEYAQHLCAETSEDGLRWECKSGRANHYLDCEVLCLVAAYVLGVKHKSQMETKRAAIQASAGGRRVVSKGVEL